jgi:hypothetical protein
MPTTPPPTDDSPVRYPEDHVLAIVDSVDEVKAAVESLTGGGFLRSEVTVLHGPAAADRLGAGTGRTGLADLAMRLVASIGLPNDETSVKEAYETALRDGRFVVLVLAPTEERKTVAGQVLRAHGGRFVNFMGHFLIEDMPRRS